MKLLALAIPLLASTAACGYRGQPPSNDVSYTTRTNRATTVVVHPPPEIVGTTRTTSSELVVDRRSGPVVASAEPDASGSRPDRRMSERIRESLRADQTLHDVALDRVRVVTTDGHVTLSGVVPTLADKVAIEHRVREIKGVEAVDNEIEVLR